MLNFSHQTLMKALGAANESGADLAAISKQFKEVNGLMPNRSKETYLD